MALLGLQRDRHGVALDHVGLMMLDAFRPTMETLEPMQLPSALGAAGIRAACGFDAADRLYGAPTRGAGITVAVVTAWNDPYVMRDLASYSRRFHLAPPGLSVSNLGSSADTAAANDWADEIALDVETIHALLPRAAIDLVEAATDSVPDVLAAVRFATGIPGVDVVSNSWGAPEWPAEQQSDAAFDDPRMAFVAAAGDRPGSILWPASSPDVVSVGGTRLTRDAHGWWRGPWIDFAASQYEPRRGPDVAMPSAPPGVKVLGSDYGAISGEPCWFDEWGTSLACPAFAAVVGAVDGVRRSRGQPSIGTGELLAGMYGSIGTPGYHFAFMDTGDAMATGLGEPRLPGFIRMFVAPNRSSKS